MFWNAYIRIIWIWKLTCGRVLHKLYFPSSVSPIGMLPSFPMACFMGTAEVFPWGKRSALIKLPRDAQDSFKHLHDSGWAFTPRRCHSSRLCPRGEKHPDLRSSRCPPQRSEKELKLQFRARLVNFLSQNLFSQPLLQTSSDMWLLSIINSRLSVCDHEQSKGHRDSELESACSWLRRCAAKCRWQCCALAFYLWFFAFDYLSKMRDGQEREGQKHGLKPNQDFWSCRAFFLGPNTRRNGDEATLAGPAILQETPWLLL